jgi:hypothetical protein
VTRPVVPSTIVRPRRPSALFRVAILALVFLPLAGFVGANTPPGSAGRIGTCGFAVAVSATPATGTAPLEVHLNATVSSGIPSAYDWAFGDGSYWNSSEPGASNPLHRYAEPGSFLAHVQVVEPTCDATGNVTVVTTPGPLVVTITATPASGATPLTVTFSASLSGGSGTYATVFWTFGDGGVGSGVPVNYTYSHAGTFTARVNVTDSAGHWAVGSALVDVRAPAPIGASFFGSWAAVGIAAVVGAGMALLGVGLLVRFRWGARGSGGPSSGGTDLPASSGTRVPLPDPSPGSVDVPPASELPTAASSDAGGRRPGARGRLSDAGRRQLTQRVILHIGSQGRLAPDDLGPAGLTQAGIATAIGIGQNSVTNVLRRLVAAGVLVHDVRHVSGQPRRLRVYRFTERGEAVYRDLWARSPGPRTGRAPAPGNSGGDGPSPGGPG